MRPDRPNMPTSSNHGIVRLPRAMAVPLLLLLLPLAGCVDDHIAIDAQLAYHDGAFEQAEAILRPEAKKTDQNYVLNNDRLGSAAIGAIDLSTAESAFFNSYEVINSANVNDAGRALSAAIIGENNKIWKGEPFERAMCNYYLGLLYYMRHDYNNSRAAFENAIFKLRDYGDPDHADQYTEFESDFTLAYLMLGKCYAQLNQPDKSQAMFDKAARIRPDMEAVAAQLRQRSNMLLVVDWGWCPRKITTVDHAFAGYYPRPEETGPIPIPYVQVDGYAAPLSGPSYPTIDLVALAQDHKWQDIDTIRAVKSVAGKALMGVGAYEGLRGAGAFGNHYNGGNLAAGLAMIAAGALIDASSQADLRQWEMLPRTTFLIPMQLTPGAHDVTVTFATGETLTWHGLIAPHRGEETYYYRMLAFGPPDRTWPPAPPAPPGVTE